MNLDNQHSYWDAVANSKTFTHPLDLSLFKKYISHSDKIVDYGCGYGRVVKQLLDAGFKEVTGYDTSIELVKRGIKEADLPLVHIKEPALLPVPDNSVDCFLLFAVLTCIPSNAGQQSLLDLLHATLKKNGIIYISDYYLQNNTDEVKRYTYLNDDPGNYGVFSLPEGASFRHHTKEWIIELTKQYTILEEIPIDVFTMNGHQAKGFQMIIKK